MTCGCALQVLPDFSGFKPLSFVDGDRLPDGTDLETWAHSLQAKEMAQSCIRRFCNLEEGNTVAKPKQHRRSTGALLKALDHALHLVTGRGLEGWVEGEGILKLLQEPALAIAESRFSTIPRTLSLVADQAGNGLSASAFLANAMREGCSKGNRFSDFSPCAKKDMIKRT